MRYENVITPFSHFHSSIKRKRVPNRGVEYGKGLPVIIAHLIFLYWVFQRGLILQLMQGVSEGFDSLICAGCFRGAKPLFFMSFPLSLSRRGGYRG